MATLESPDSAVVDDETADERRQDRARATEPPLRTPDEREPYVPFGNAEARNGLQAGLEIPFMLRALRPPRGGRLLEVGCGRGVALPELARRLAPAELTGLDLDPALLGVASERLRADGIAGRLVEGDVRDLPFESGSFDLVVDFGTCYHVAGGVEGAARALREIARVLCPGGLFIHETPLAQHLAHPVRSFARTLPWRAAPSLVRERSALLWAMRRRRQRRWLQA